MKKKLLITGCGRSGTKYFSILLRQVGVDISHEVMGNDGICSWLYAAEDESPPWGQASTGYQFEHTIQLVRHPLLVIPSVTTFKHSAWCYIRRNIEIDEGPCIVQSMQYWLKWNQLAEVISDERIYIEDVPEALNVVSRRLGRSIDTSIVERVPKNINTRRLGHVYHAYESKLLKLGLHYDHPILKFGNRLGVNKLGVDKSWVELNKLAPDITEQVRTKAIEYGYQ